MASDDSPSPALIVALVLLAVFVFIPVVGMGVGGFGMGPMDGWMWGDGPWMPWFGLVALFVQLLFGLAVLVAGYFLVRHFLSAGDGTDPAIRELREAYARGDLSDEEFERRRDRLGRDRDE